MRKKINIIFLFVLIISIITMNFIVLAADPNAPTYGGTDNITKIDPTQQVVITNRDPDGNPGWTSTQVTVIHGQNSVTKRYSQGDGVDGTNYNGYDWYNFADEAPNGYPRENLFGSNDEISKLMSDLDFSPDIVAAVKNNQQTEDVIVVVEPVIHVRNGNEVVAMPVTEVIRQCEEAAANGVKAGEGIRWIEESARDILARLKEENPDAYAALLTFEDGQGQGVHKLDKTETELTPTPTPTPTKTTTVTKTPTPTPTPTPTMTPVIVETPERPSYSYLPGLADESTGGKYYAKVYNNDWGVYQHGTALKDAGDPIATTETLNVEANSNIIGDVKNLGKVTVEFKNDGKYTYKGKYYTYTWNDEVPEQRNASGEVIQEYVPAQWVSDSGQDLTYNVEITATKTFTEIYNGSNDYEWTGDMTDYGKRKAITVSNEALGGAVEMPCDSEITYAPYDISSNISLIEPDYTKDDFASYSNLNITDIYNKDAYTTGVSYETAKKTFETYVDENKNIDHFYKITSDTLSSTVGNITTNGPVAGTKVDKTTASKTIPATLPNKSLNDAYPSSGTHTFYYYVSGITNNAAFTNFKCGENSHEFINSVRIHTPINIEELSISNNNNNNQYLGNKSTDIIGIVTLGDKYTLNIETNGNSHYYGTIDTTKYIKSAKIWCELCNAQGMSLSKRNGKFYHDCSVKPYIEDNKSYNVTVEVVAINVNKHVIRNTPDYYNVPDDEDIIRRTQSIYVVGRMYDLETRRTDDPLFKLSSAQMLAQLPIGEKKDNTLNTNYGIKLGYRAYFDLKTLGKSITDITLRPRLYYITADGNKVYNESEVDFWYREANGYKKLTTDNYVKVGMNIMNTIDNLQKDSDYKNERNATIGGRGSVDHTKMVQLINGSKLKLNSITNSVFTLNRYTTATDNSFRGENSRRWYGEIRIPASTIVAKKDTPQTGLTNKNNLYTTGYILITFDPIQALVGGSNYLQYDVSRPCDALSFSSSYIGKNDSQLYKEKIENSPNNLNAIQLPNGTASVATSKFGSNFNGTDAPIIIYDVSQRANNDYETTGTH